MIQTRCHFLRNAIVPVKDSRIGELAARFDIVLGFTPRS